MLLTPSVSLGATGYIRYQVDTASLHSVMSTMQHAICYDFLP